jgi:hypothetical protein
MLWHLIVPPDLSLSGRISRMEALHTEPHIADRENLNGLGYLKNLREQRYICWDSLGIFEESVFSH